MKYIKKFESNIRLLKNYYVLCYENPIKFFYQEDDTNEFINNNVGKYIEIERDFDNPYKISYDNVPGKLLNDFIIDENNNIIRYFSREEIIYFSKNKEDVETFLLSKKYNL